MTTSLNIEFLQELVVKIESQYFWGNYFLYKTFYKVAIGVAILFLILSVWAIFKKHFLLGLFSIFIATGFGTGAVLMKIQINSPVAGQYSQFLSIVKKYANAHKLNIDPNLESLKYEELLKTLDIVKGELSKSVEDRLKDSTKKSASQPKSKSKGSSG